MQDCTPTSRPAPATTPSPAPAFTEGFIERRWRKPLLGTDYFLAGQEIPQIARLRTYPMPDQWRQGIGRANAAAVISPQRR